MIQWLDDGDSSVQGNPSSVHAEGQRARSAVERARRQIADAIGSALTEVVFTSGATEANNLALRSLPHPVATTAVEHPSVLGANVPLCTIPVDPAGRLPEPAALVQMALAAGARSLSVMFANNETGTIHPIAAIAQAAAAEGLPMHCDATQALGRIPLDVGALGPALISFSSHKIGGPKGAGALWANPDYTLAPIIRGGHQERGRRGGTENVLAIVGFGAAAAAINPDAWARVAALRDQLWEGILAIDPAAIVHGDPEARLPNTLNVRFPGVDGEGLLINLDLAGIAASAGSACSAGSLEPSHVILAMGVSDQEAREAVRFSLGPDTTGAEIEATLDTLRKLITRIRMPGWDTPT